MSKKITTVCFAILITFSFAIGFSTLAAWTNPTATPVGGNTEPPVTVGSANQTKAGNLTVANLYLNASALEGNVGYINRLEGYNDLLLYGDSTKTAPIYLEGSSVVINNDAGTGNVGIGIAIPLQKLHVSGVAQAVTFYASTGVSTFDTTVAAGTVEASQFCLGNGANCITV
ncbi:MAG: hypothetical protein ABIF89_02235, partial [bacterium]